MAALPRPLRGPLRRGELNAATLYRLLGQPPADDVRVYRRLLEINPLLLASANATLGMDSESGDIVFYYTQLTPLKQDLSPNPLPPIEMKNKTKVASVSKEFTTDIKTLFYTSGHFEFRNQWLEGVKKIEQLDHLLPAVGMRLKYTTDEGEKIIYSSSFYYDPASKIIFSETDENKKSATYFVLEKINDHKTKLTVDYYIARNLLAQAMFKLSVKKKMEAKLQRSLVNLESFIKEIRLPVEF